MPVPTLILIATVAVNINLEIFKILVQSTSVNKISAWIYALSVFRVKGVRVQGNKAPRHCQPKGLTVPELLSLRLDSANSPIILFCFDQ